MQFSVGLRVVANSLFGNKVAMCWVSLSAVTIDKLGEEITVLFPRRVAQVEELLERINA